LFAAVEKPLPGALEIHARLEEVVEPATEKILDGAAKQPARGRVGIDECPLVIDHDHAVTGGGEERLDLLLARHPS
jgi:hypothetical protein